MRAAATTKAVARQGKTPTAAGVAKLADVGYGLAQETVELWTGERRLGVYDEATGVAREVASWLIILGGDKPGPSPVRIHIGALTIEAASDLISMCGGPLNPRRRRRKRKR